MHLLFRFIAGPALFKPRQLTRVCGGRCCLGRDCLQTHVSGLPNHEVASMTTDTEDYRVYFKRQESESQRVLLELLSCVPLPLPKARLRTGRSGLVSVLGGHVFCLYDDWCSVL